MPPLMKPHQAGMPHSNHHPHFPPHQNHSSHSEQMTAANKKHYEPLHWDVFFDELSYLDDVKLN